VGSLPPFVSPEWVAAHLDDIVLVDCRWSLSGDVGRGDYLASHLPGAVFADLDTDLAAPPSPEGGRHPLPAPTDFAAAMSRLGIGADDTVVAYDQSHGAVAARLAWMLRVTGHAAAVLDGGLAAWPGDLESGEAVRPAATFMPSPWPLVALADAEDVAAASASGGTIVDVRSAERYRGDVELVDARPGHVPGAVNLPHDSLAGPRGRLIAAADLGATFAAAQVDGDAIMHCGSGVTACLGVLAAEQAGCDRPRLFAGSWSVWAADPDRPAVTGPTPYPPA
jgi:thiosulfate/3-mercaptopyruvate sulfurtransferase